MYPDLPDSYKNAHNCYKASRVHRFFCEIFLIPNEYDFQPFTVMAISSFVEFRNSVLWQPIANKVVIFNFKKVSHTWSFSVYSVFLLTLTKSGTPIEISFCHFDNFNHPWRDQPVSLYMKHVMTEFLFVSKCSPCLHCIYSDTLSTAKWSIQTVKKHMFCRKRAISRIINCYTAVGQLRGPQGAICASKVPKPHRRPSLFWTCQT